MDTLERPHKRPRSNGTAEDRDTAAGSIAIDSDVEPIVRDEIYYCKNGDCVILVGRVLFKVRKCIPPQKFECLTQMPYRYIVSC